MENVAYTYKGLTHEEIRASQSQYGSNTTSGKKKNTLLKFIWKTATEPMFLILLTCSILYWVLGKSMEALYMSVYIFLIFGIAFYQEVRNKNALDAIKAFSQNTVQVIRNGATSIILSEELVIGDHIIVFEGNVIPADAHVLQANDFTVNESILTGESNSVSKVANDSENDFLYQGTLVQSGQALAVVTALAQSTRLAKIGHSIENIKIKKTPLQKNIDAFVKWIALVGAFVFLILWGVNYYESRDVINSLLKGLTIAMSIIPEEIPVAFTTFIAIGSFRLLGCGILVKQGETIELLGSVNVLCMDKTGTLTENSMQLSKLYTYANDAIIEISEASDNIALDLITTAMWASESIPFDPMEKSLHEWYGKLVLSDQRRVFHIAHEYPLSGRPPMMTHIFEDEFERRIVACKGAPETVLNYCGLSESEKEKILKKVAELAKDGLRILGVANAPSNHEPHKEKQEDILFTFIGLVCFIDPPKSNIKEVILQFYQAGIELKIITGDNSATTCAIAKQIGLKNPDEIITGEELMQIDEKTLSLKMKTVNVFTRMFPEAKLRIINCLKDNHQIVGMTGDGVNDGPSLKAAHIGIAMGKKGSEIAKLASSLILTDDDLSHMVEAVAMGRKIYNNLKKAIQYIISIHIPIILTVLIPILLGWIYPTIFSPIHVIFLELIMGPTCSIAYENEPLEKNSMLKPPRLISHTFLSFKELLVSLIQGLIITGVLLGIYYYLMMHGYSEDYTRTIVFTSLVFTNILLSLVNRSSYYSILTTFKYHNRLLKGIVFFTLSLLLIIIYVTPIAHFFQLIPLNAISLLISLLIAFTAVMWFEVYKWIKRLEFNSSVD